MTVCAPLTLMPEGIEKMGVKAAKNIKEGAAGANVLMALRLQLERQKAGLFPSLTEYNHFFNINDKLISLADKDAIVMHPGPMNRGLEISSAAADSNASVITRQVTNGVAVRMAILERLLK